jgi:uncharacterized protein YyaL (SSP411 family)
VDDPALREDALRQRHSCSRLCTGRGRDRRPLFRVATLETADWLLRDLQRAGGRLHSALDADSEGHEGRFYVWTPDEARCAARRRRNTKPSRVVTASTARRTSRGTGTCTSRRSSPTSPRPGARSEAASTHLERGTRASLLAARNARTWPGSRRQGPDELERAGHSAAWRVAAVRWAEPGLPTPRARARVHARALWQDGRLLATCTGGQRTAAAYLDDYAFLADGLLELLAGTLARRRSTWAMRAGRGMLAHFEDRDAGGFFFTADDHETLIHRPKTFGDDATAGRQRRRCACALIRLGHLLGETWCGSAGDPDLDAAERRAIAYVCRGASCSAPAGNPAELLARLQEPR